ncbi:PAS domain S-box protein [Planctomycetaceae bacterium SH139]
MRANAAMLCRPTHCHAMLVAAEAFTFTRLTTNSRIPAVSFPLAADVASLTIILLAIACGGLFAALGVVTVLWLRTRGKVAVASEAGLPREAVLKAVPDMLFVLDREGVFLEYRSGVGTADGERVCLAGDSEQIIGRHFEEVLTDDAASQLRTAMKQTQLSGELVVIEYTIDQETGRRFEARVSDLGDGRSLVLSRDVTDRRRILEQWQELQALRLAINEHTLFSIADARGRIIDINDGFCKISGYAREELLGRDHRILNSGHHPKSFWVEMWKTIAAGKPWRAEVCNRAKDGSLYWVDSTNIPLESDDGKVKRYISLRFDITERKRLETENSRAMARYSALFDGSRDAVLMLNETGFIGCNQAAFELFGVQSSRALQQVHPAEISPEYQKDGKLSRVAADEHIQRAYRDGSDRFEWVHKRLDTGESFHAEVLLSAHPIDGEMILQAVVRDISERVESRQRLTSIYEAMSEGIVLHDVSGRVLECNPAAEAVLGIPHEEIFGRSLNDPRWTAIREDGSVLPTAEMPAARTLRTGKSVQGFVHGFIRPDGQQRWLSVSSEPVCENDGSLRGVVTSIADITTQHEQRRELTTQKRILEAVLDSPTTGFWDWKISDGVEHFSPSWLRMFGYEPGELPETPETWQQLMDPDDLRETMQRFTTHVESRGGVPFYSKVRYRHKNGSTVWVLCIGRVVEWSGEGEPLRMAGCHIDVTTACEAELQIEEQKRELQAILDAIPGFVFYKDGNNKILDLNRAAADSIGLPKEQIRYRAAEEFFPAEDANRYLEDDQAVLRSGQAKLGIIECYETGGEIKHIRTDKIPLRSPNGQYDRLVAIAMDITEIVESRERASEAQHRLNMALRASNTGLWEWDIQTGSALFSDTWYSMLGYEPGELPMEVAVWKELCHQDDFERASQELERHFRGETDVYKCEHRLRRKDGSWSWVRGVGEVLERADDGTPLKAVGVNIDIQQLRESVIRMEAASQAKSEFLANMSHEIRTPMTAILGYADLIMEPTSSPQDFATHVRTIQANAGHLLTIINDILDMSKIEAGQMTIERIDTNPAQIVEEVASLLRPRAIGKGITLGIVYDTPIPLSIHSDPTRLRQILLNLAGNSIKFTEIGSVTIHAACDAGAERMTFRVVDTGIGMSEKQRAAIARFEAFSQADTSTTRKFGGTGLGLRISNSLATMLGGGIEVASTLNEGSEFTVTIATGSLTGVKLHTPAQICELADSDEQETSSERLAAKKVDGQQLQPLLGLRVLLAEDGPDNQRLISFHLKKAGAEVILADNGLIAAETIESATADTMPHLVLMDMQMPELDGYAATKRLRCQGYRLPIIALTAHAMEGDRQKCLNAGCIDYLTKPIDKARLIECCTLWATISDQPTPDTTKLEEFARQANCPTSC